MSSLSFVSAALLALVTTLSIAEAAGPIYRRNLPKGKVMKEGVYIVSKVLNLNLSAPLTFFAGFKLTCFDGQQLLSTPATKTTTGTCVACTPGTASMDGLRCTPCEVGFNATLSHSKVGTWTFSVNLQA